MLALLISCPLVWAALTSVIYVAYRQHQALRVGNFSEWPVALQLQDALATVEEPAAVRTGCG
jgi:hypothetical protein